VSGSGAVEQGRTRPGASPAVAHLDAAACVLFTSASTGPPKGVVLTHRGLANLAFAATRRFALGPEDRFLQLSSPSFAAFLEEVFPPLVSGGAVVMAGYARAMPSVPRFLQVLADDGVTAFEITTAHWHQLVDDLVETGARLPPSVRLVVMGSERPLPDRVAAWAELGVPLVHVYGPTETTATATYFLLGEEATDAGHDWVLPVGRVIPNTDVHLCDRSLDLVPRGLPGEAFIGGSSLARGYLENPVMTAERYVADPFDGYGARLFRTGDVARVRPDGNLEFLSRAAHLLKVHGCRVNPAEVEAALESHPSVRVAVVLSEETPQGDSRLCAHLVPSPGNSPDPAELRVHVAARLPSFCVPAVLVEVDELPLNPHGKVDRAALARRGAPPVEPSAPRAAGSAPATPTERTLAGIWATVLGRDGIGRDDDFFALGGDSLHVVRLATLVHRHLEVNLQLRQVFTASTLRQQAELVDATDADGVDVDEGAAPP
jgi:mycobactin peptide synthetase MbtE